MRAAVAVALITVACAGCHSRKVHHRVDPIRVDASVRINIAAQAEGKRDTRLGDTVVKAMIGEGTAAYELLTGCLGHYAMEGRWPQNLLELERGLRHANANYGPPRRVQSFSVKEGADSLSVSFVGTDGTRGDISMPISPLK